VRPTLGARLAAAARWQLGFAAEHGGLFTITEANWRGVGAADVGAASAMWDLLRSGYQDAYINARYVASLQAMLELQAAGLVLPDEGGAAVTAADVAAAKAAFVAAFGTADGKHSRSPSSSSSSSSSSYSSWVSCDRVVGGAANCSGGVGARAVDIGFVPTLALAAALDVRGEGAGAALARFDAARDAARHVSGRFRTNTRPIEAVDPALWRASSRWGTSVDARGFALRRNSTPGDWQIFNPTTGAADGYGQWGNTEENGGVLMSTSALVFQAGPYGDAMLADFEAPVRALANASLQLAAGAGGVAAGPLLAAAGQRDLLRARIAPGSVPMALCEQARRLKHGGRADRWGEHWCDYYKDVSWNLPGAGAFVFGWAKGLLQLQLPLPTAAEAAAAAAAGSAAVVTVYGTAVREAAGSVAVALPAWAQPRWPRAVAAVEVIGMNVGGRPHSLLCNATTGGGGGSRAEGLACTLTAD